MELKFELMFDFTVTLRASWFINLSHLRKLHVSVRILFAVAAPRCLPRNYTLYCKMDNRHTESDAGEVSSAKAVLLGALAPGVNGPTWITLKSTFLMLGLSLAVMLGLAFSSSDSALMIHVAFLVLICVTLFLLLSWFLAQTGLVSTEYQMREMGLGQNIYQDTTKKSE